MSSLNEKIDGIKEALEYFKKRKEQLEFIKGERRNSPAYRACIFELDICINAINKGEKLLKELQENE